MHKFLFLLESALGKIRHKPLRNVSMVASLGLGLLFPLLVMIVSQQIMVLVQSETFIDIEKRSAFTFQTYKLTPDDEKKLTSHIPGLSIIKSWDSAFVQVFVDDIIENRMMSFKHPELLAMQPVPITRGRGFASQDYENRNMICIITENMQMDHPSLTLGSRISVQGRELEIVGITNTLILNNLILVPFTLFPLFSNDTSETYVFTFPYNVSNEQNELLAQYIAENISGERPVYKRLQEGSQADINRIKTISFAFFIVSLLVLLYSILNISTLFFHIIEERRNEIGIRIALGATRLAILSHLFFEVFFLSLCAFLFDILFLPLTSLLLQAYGFPINFTLSQLIPLVSVPIVTSLVLVLNLVKKVFSIEINEVIRT